MDGKLTAMIEINLIENPPRSLARPVAAAVAVAAIAAFVYIKTGETPAPSPETETRSAARPSAKQQPPARESGRGKKGLRVTGFVRYAGSEFAMLVSGRKSLWVEKGREAFGGTVSEVREDGVFVSRGEGTEFFPLRK
ncbi:MAG: hypothetical protein OXF42_03525 [Candidatus Dadabacteria bacterium]|nr:hypothetical protein [Candidatus Dadabacteria bacterium]